MFQSLSFLPNKVDWFCLAGDVYLIYYQQISLTNLKNLLRMCFSVSGVIMLKNYENIIGTK